jgi:signal transduction histidine kinase
VTVSGAGGVGPIRIAGEGVVYDFAVPVGGHDGDAASGRLVEVRDVSEARGVELIEGLIGSDARIFVGANRGDVWSNLSVPVPGPPVDSTTRGLVRYTDDSGQDVVGVAGALPGAPWLVWVQFPQGTVLSPQRTFVRRAGMAMIVILLLGSAGAWTVGRRIATPLRHVTETAEEIASGQYSSRVARTSNDETGRLASAFNSMAERIETDHRELEHRVAARTRELHGTLVQLQEAQDQLVRREKLAMLGQLASGVGHELRNPLGVMSNAVYYLEMVLESASTEVREYLGIIKGQVALSEKIVGDLLDFARIKPPRSDIVALDTLVSDQLARLDPPAGVRIVQDFPQGLPTVHVDRVQMGQVVLNLLANAFQAMEDGPGTLTLRGVEVAPGRVRLDVTDTGVGISEEDLSKIFEPLYTTKARGIGLGLAVARSLAEANRGALTVTSRPGEGASFSLEVPTTAAEAAA